MKRFWIIVSLISLSLFTTNCTKEDWTPDGAELSAEVLPATATIDDTLSQFLTYDYLSSVNEALLPMPSLRSGIVTDSLVEAAMLALEDLDAQHGYIKNIVRKYGYPVWDRSTILYATHREEIIITPLAFEDGESITGYFISIHLNEVFWFRLVKKDKLEKAINGKGNLKDWENLPFAVLESVIVDKDLFGYVNQPFINWLLAKGNSETGAMSSLRSCTTVQVEHCVESDELLQALVAGDLVCYSYYDSICDSPGGDSGRCQECTGSTDGGSTSGGSSGGGSTDNSSDLLPYSDAITSAEMLRNLDAVAGLDADQEAFLISNPAILQQIYDSYNQTTNLDQRALAMNTTMEDVASIIDPFEFLYEALFLRLEHPDWPEWRVQLHAGLNVMLNKVHTTLDIIGLLPGFGEPADFANAGLYLIEGDAVNASISLAATLPFVGWTATGSKYAMKAVKSAKGSNVTLHMRQLDNGKIWFNKSATTQRTPTFRSILGTKTGEVAHHIIPLNMWDNPIVQKAAESGKFHLNDGALNGINIPSSLHGQGYNTAHRVYDSNLSQVLAEMEEVYYQESPDFLFQKLKILNDNIKAQLNNGVTLDNIVMDLP